jgi:hypothetical protein
MARIEEYGLVKLKGLLYGDDNWATVIDESSPKKNDRGIEMKKYLIIPGEHLMKQYPELQKPGALPVRTRWGDAIWVEYPTYWIDDRNPSRTNAIARIDCGYDGRETTQTKKHKHFTDEIKTLREELEIATISNMHLTEENKSLLSDKKAMIKDNVEMLNIARGGSGRYEKQEFEDKEGE